jgi:hypothetical protein
MRDNATRRGAADMGTPLMILAFFVIAGFMYWLNGQAAAERALEIVEDTTVDATAGVADVPLTDLEASPAEYVGREVRLATYGVASMLGQQGFWLGTPSGNPFLISMSDALMAEGLLVSPGDTIMVAGVVTEMSDSVLSAWEAAATIDETDRIVAEFAIHFVEANAITITGDGGGSDGN